MEKLIGMTDFVLEQKEQYPSAGRSIDKMAEILDCIENYVNFLKQPLTLGMFVPCDEDGNVLNEPTEEDYENGMCPHESYEYEKAKERVLFEGFEIAYVGENIISVVNKMDINFSFNKETLKSAINKNIEYIIDYEIQLTETAKKQIGL